MTNLKIRDKFKDMISSLQNIQGICAYGEFENKRSLIDYSYLLFQFKKVKKSLKKLKENQNNFIEDKEKAKLKRNSQTGSIKTSVQEIKVFDFLDNWENFLSGIKQSFDFILSEFKKKRLLKKQNRNNKNFSFINFINDSNSNLIELKEIFDDVEQFKNIITTRNAFTHNYFMKVRLESHLKLKYLDKIAQNTFVENVREYQILSEAEEIFERYFQLVGVFLYIIHTNNNFISN